jgi:hypothetical protein
VSRDSYLPSRITHTIIGDEIMKQFRRPLAVVVACTMLALPRLSAAQTAPAIPPAISTPDKVGTRIGALDFKDGAPNAATVTKVYEAFADEVIE